MNKNEAINRLAEWRRRTKFLGSLKWAGNFYAESLRDMTASIAMSNWNDVELDENRVTGLAADMTHAMILRMTS